MAFPMQAAAPKQNETEPAPQCSAARATGHLKLTWESPKLLSVKAEWGAFYVSLPFRSSKDMYAENCKKLDAILAKRLSDQDLRDLSETCIALPPEPIDLGPFNSSLLQRMLYAFVTSGDRDSLVAMLSRRFPPKYYAMDTEDFLVRFGRRVRDPALILGEAYSQCRTPEVRALIATAVRHGFAGSGVKGKDDAAFVANAMRWYEQNKARLVFNDAYGYNAAMAIVGGGYRTNPLFKFKSGVGAGDKAVHQ
jgi:hypothetical protein